MLRRPTAKNRPIPSPLEQNGKGLGKGKKKSNSQQKPPVLPPRSLTAIEATLAGRISEELPTVWSHSRISLFLFFSSFLAGSS
jgi:hypothetical protein